jgi:tellurite methyltransferase
MAKTYVSYWENIYQSGAIPEEPSQFATYVVKKYAKPGQSLIELGCGNGRDAFFFAQEGLDVQALDQCASEIEELMKTNGQHKNLQFSDGDFTELDDSDDPHDIIYSRFTLHSVTAEGQQKTLEWCYRNLEPGGLLCIETRGQKNEIYKKGKPVEGEPDAYIYNDHYRRFVDFEKFVKDIKDVGFSIVESAEETGFAPFKGTDYHFIRVIAKK